jgi:glycogen phosphorylase
MKNIYKFPVVPSLPKSLEKLSVLAKNMWFCWNFDALQLFMRLDRVLWEEVGQNPIALLGRVSQKRLELLSKDEAYLHSLETVSKKFEEAMKSGRKFETTENSKNLQIAYFSLEFGLHESLPIYSGGLGVLAGDHLKSSSDIGLPLTAVSLLYREGYFRQYLNADGWQQETYPDNDFYNMPIHSVIDENGDHLVVEVDFPNKIIYCKIWRIQVGRVPLILLDANIDKNSIEDREITAQLYGGDIEMRLRQEYVLGVGGIIALKKMGYNPSVFHMNEGHSAFLGLKRIKDLMNDEGLNFWQAKEACSYCNIFTTHTPVPAGIDKFSPQLMDKYFWKYREAVGITREQFLGLGRENNENNDEPFSLAVLALKLSARYNGVSELHGKVSRKMWKKMWPEIPINEIPITHVTNGIHNKTWISNELNGLFERYLGPKIATHSENKEFWKHVDRIPDAELWRTHERRRERLVGFVRERVKKQYLRKGIKGSELKLADEVLDPDTLTIGFARRFATYKRSTLLFHDLDRLKAILHNVDKPVQFIFAGKAHPKDNLGKELIRKIIHNFRNEKFCHHLVFIEDYDMNVARYMLQGVDIWLNNPRRPLEASGTSGMKAAANGVLNFSILDGWWCEGYTPDVGWSIGNGEEYSDLKYQDEVESRTFYDLLEKEITDTFYNRGTDGIPRKWVQMMKSALKELAPVFNTNRMVAEYANKFYVPLTERSNIMSKNNYELTKELTDWKFNISKNWNKIRVINVSFDKSEEIKVGQSININVKTHLDALNPEDINVHVLYGAVDPEGEIIDPQIKILDLKNEIDGENNWLYSGTILCNNSGIHGFATRIIPFHNSLASIHETGLIKWG